MKLAELCARFLRLFGSDSQAAAVYAETNLSASLELYQTGLALAKLNDLVGCLRRWQQIDSDHPDFLAQKEHVSLLLLEELHRRLDENPLAQEKEAWMLAEEFSLFGLLGGDALLTRCRSLRLARLWQEEALEDIAAMTDQTDWLQSAALAVQAKTACQLMAADRTVPAAQARQFIDAWLTLLVHPEVGPQTESQRQVLLDFGAEQLRRQAARQRDNGVELLQQWEETQALLQRLHTLTAGPVYAPALALRAGVVEQHFVLIQNNREVFADDSQWIAAGAAYSPAAKALFLVREGEYEAALDALTNVEEADDPFAAWGAAQVRTACGLRCLRDGQCREAEQILTDGPAHWTAELEQQLLAVLEQNEDRDGGQLTACLGILTLLPENSEADSAFCTALTNQAIRLRGSEETSPRLLAALTAKAVALHPSDEFARMTADQMRCNLELTQLDEAFTCDCFAEAGRLAAASRFPQVQEHFFDIARSATDRIERGDYSDQEAAVFMLEELLSSVCAVDGAHEAVRRIRQALDSLRPAGTT